MDLICASNPAPGRRGCTTKFLPLQVHSLEREAVSFSTAMKCCHKNYPTYFSLDAHSLISARFTFWKMKTVNLEKSSLMGTKRG